MEKGDLSLFCAHCNISLEKDQGLSSISFGDEVVPVCDALAYLCGIPIKDFVELSKKCDSIEDNRFPQNGEEEDEVLVCQNCVPLLTDFYKTHRLFQSAIHPSSFVVRIKEKKKFCHRSISRQKSKSPPPPVTLEIKNENIIEDEASYFSPAHTDEKKCEGDLVEDFNFEEDNDDDNDGQFADVDVEEKFEIIEYSLQKLAQADSSELPLKSKSSTVIKELVIKLKRLSSEYLSEKYGIQLENVKNEDVNSGPTESKGKLLRSRTGQFVPIEEKWKSDLSVIEKRSLRHKYGPNREPGPWKCEHCDKVFTHYHCYKFKHLPKHNIDRDQIRPCSICDERVKGGRKVYLKHLRDAHGNNTSIPCKICGKSFTTRVTIFRHLKITHGIGHTPEEKEKKQDRKKEFAICEICGASIRKYILSQHIKLVHSDVIYKCDKCGKQYKKKISYEKHLLTHCSNLVQNKYVKDEEPWRELESDLSETDKKRLRRKFGPNWEPGPWKCEICGKVYTHYSTFKFKHLPTHDKEIPLECHICDEKVKGGLGAVFKHRREAHDHQTPCKLCGKTFLKLEYLVHHLKTVHGLGEEETDKKRKAKAARGQQEIVICDKVRTHYSKFKNKHGPTYDKEILLECHICDEKVKGGLGALFKHRREAHENQTPCKLCGKTFLKRKYLIGHLQIVHGLGETETKKKRREARWKETVICDVCGKGIVRHHMKNHIRKVHLGHCYKCDKCEKQYKNKRIYEDHLLTHEPNFQKHICTICGMTFDLSSYLKVHKLYKHHTKGDKFACDLCPRTFSSQSYLDTHKFSHSTEKQFKCQCGRSFQRPSQLNFHKRHNCKYE